MPKQNTDNNLHVRVECYAGYQADEKPLRFYLGQRRVEIIDIVDQWHGPDYRYFKVCGDDKSIYILRYDENKNVWELTMFDSNKPDSTRLTEN